MAEPLPEGELFSFRIVDTRRKCLVPWHIADVQEHTTFLGVFEELSVHLPDGARVPDTSSVKCFVGQSPTAVEKECANVSLGLRVVRCARFGVYGTYIVESPVDPAKDQPLNAFTTMMAASAAASRPKFSLPEKHVPPAAPGQSLRGDYRLENDIIDLLAKMGVGFRNGAEKTSGKTFVRLLRSVLFEILPPTRLQRLKDRGLQLPDIFVPFTEKEAYNDPGKSKHAQLQQLTRVRVLELASNTLEARAMPELQNVSWQEMHRSLGLLAKNLERYAAYLESTTKRMNVHHSMMEPARTPADGSSSSVQRKEGTIRTAEKASRYSSLEAALQNSEPYDKVIFLGDHAPGDRFKRFTFVHELELPFPFEIYAYHQGGSLGTLWWMWRAPNDPLETDMTASVRRVQEINKAIPMYSTRAMRREFTQRFQLVAGASKTVLNEMYRFVSGDMSASPQSVSTAVRSRLLFALDAQDPGLIYDLRHLNAGRPSTYDAFWDACKAFIEDQALQAVDSRRHGKVTHMAVAVSTRDFIAQVSKRLPAEEQSNVPSESWVRLQFWPANPFYASAARYTGRLALKHAVQSRQLSHHHPDEHYAAAVFRYLRELAVKARDVCSLVFQDDKHSMKVGEPNHPVAAVDRGKSVLVGRDVSFVVADHDFTKIKLIPSVALVCDVPEEISSSFYAGQLAVSLKEAAFEPSSPLRHAAELVSDLKAAGVNTILKPVLLLYTDGGPDHRLTFGAVKIALLLLFRKLNLDYLVAARTCPMQSWKNPVERCMSLLNIGLQSIGLMRAEMSPEDEARLKPACSTSAIREAAVKAPALKKAILESVKPTKELVGDVMERLELHGKAVKTRPAATEGRDR